jgi:tripartite-type tricarboxylate transporter receptor subunit TctC
MAARCISRFLSPLIAKQHVAHGDVLALGITSAKRAAGWPDTPTIAEAGVPGYAMDAWYAILAPRGTPQDVVDKLSAAIAVAVKSPDVSEKLETLGNVAVGSSPAEAASYIEAEAKQWHDLLGAAGVHVD